MDLAQEETEDEPMTGAEPMAGPEAAVLQQSISVDAADLHDAVAFVRRATDARAYQPILSFVRLRLDGNDLVVEGTDLDVTLRIRIAVGPGPFPTPVLVEPKPLLAALKGSKGTVVLDAQATPRGLRLAVAGASLTILLDRDYPRLVDTADVEAELVMSRVDLEAIDYANRAASTDETRAHINQIHFEPSGKGALALGTNGNVLHFAPVARAAAFGLPRRSIELLAEARKLHAVKTMKPLEVFAGCTRRPVEPEPGKRRKRRARAEAPVAPVLSEPDVIVLEVGPAEIAVKAREGKFPPWGHLRVREDARAISVEAARLVEASDRVVRRCKASDARFHAAKWLIDGQTLKIVREDESGELTIDVPIHSTAAWTRGEIRRAALQAAEARLAEVQARFATNPEDEDVVLALSLAERGLAETQKLAPIDEGKENEPFCIGFDHRLLAQALAGATGEVVIRFAGDELDPIQIERDDGYGAVVMPARI